MDAVALAAGALGLLLHVLGALVALGLQLASLLLACLACVCGLPRTVLATLTSVVRGLSLPLLASLTASLRFPGDGLQTLGAGAGPGDQKPSGPEPPDQAALSASSGGHASLCHVYMYVLVLSPVVCVVSSWLSICLRGTQNLSSLALARWGAAVGMEVVAACLAYVSSSAATLAVLFWPFSQVALELLLSVGRLLIIVSFSLTGFVLLACMVAVTVTVLHPDFILRLASRALHQFQARSSYQRLRQNVAQLSHLATGLEAWLQVWRRNPLLARVSSRGGVSGTPQGGRRRVFTIRIQRQQNHPAVWSIRAAPAQGPQNLQEDAPAAGRDTVTVVTEPEDQKKCVICRDRTKCVLLLPCRHLCLCQICSEILMRHSSHRRNCPLCRRGIQRTLKVYL